ncbi:MAG: hypothetical protein WCR74_01160 [Betaproteobacteria bacterium]
MTRNRSSSVYLVWLFGTMLVLLAVSVALSFYFEPLTGDLTRIGPWSERDFGPRDPQSAVARRAGNSTGARPQVLVLGDSFSYANTWQSYLAEFGKFETQSFQFKDVGCIDNWLNWVFEQRGSGAQILIIQVAERGFVPLFAGTRTCPRSLPKATGADMKDKRVAGIFSGLTIDVVYLFRTAMNTARLRFLDGRFGSGDTVNVPLNTPALFSNRRADRLLYYAEDENKRAWTDKDIRAAVDNLQQIQARIARNELRLVLAVVPDKSTVYRPYILTGGDRDEYPDIFPAIATAGINSVDLLKLFRRQVDQVVDLYLPNDTHLGSTGYRLMAVEILEHLKREGGSRH